MNFEPKYYEVLPVQNPCLPKQALRARVIEATSLQQYDKRLFDLPPANPLLPVKAVLETKVHALARIFHTGPFR